MNTATYTLDQLRSMPLSEIQDVEGKKRNRIGATKAIQYKIADCSEDHASRAIVIDSPSGSRQVILSSDSQWDQFMHRGF